MNQQPQSSRIIYRGTKAPINIPPYDGLAKSEINATTGDCCARCTAVYPAEWLGLACWLYSDSTLYGVYGLVHHTASGTQNKRKKTNLVTFVKLYLSLKLFVGEFQLFHQFSSYLGRSLQRLTNWLLSVSPPLFTNRCVYSVSAKQLTQCIQVYSVYRRGFTVYTL